MKRLAVDVGGTFTDIVLFDEATGRITTGKSATTPREPVKGILEGIGSLGVNLSQVGLIVHASTLGTNLFLGQIGLEPPKAALITNRGFEDVVEIGRQNRPSLYNLYRDKPRPLIPRKRRLGIPGRIGPGGEELEPLDKDYVARLAGDLCREGVRVYAVSLLHSYANPSHEEEAEKVILEECPGSIVVLSSRVDPQPLEYERTSTTIVNAVLKPVLSRYLERLQASLAEKGFRGGVLVMQSNGGVASIGEAARRPAAFIESGPSAGAIATAYMARLLGVEKALGFDMGGTTAKASSIIGGEPSVVDMYEVGGETHMGRPVPGTGYPVRYPHIDLAEVSAGGGTIAWIDPGGALRVGPVSAGADPGPACYGRGGRDPTVTDANLVLGRLPRVIGGSLRLDEDLARQAIARLAERLGVGVVDTAWMIISLANDEMARALRIVTVERGQDPREFTLFAFGGAGPLHAAELAEALGVRRIIVPPHAGVYSALGLLLADYRHSLHRPIAKPASKLTVEEVEEAFRSMEEEADRILEEEGIPVDKRRYARLVEARYWGQGYTLRVPYRGSIEALVEEFHRLHEARYGFSARGEEVFVTLARLEAVGLTEKPRLRHHKEPGDPQLGEREVFFREGWLQTPVYSRERLEVGFRLAGPAIVEARDTTILVPPGFEAGVDGAGNLVMERGGPGWIS